MHRSVRYEPLDDLEAFFSVNVPMWIFDQASLAFLEVNDAAVHAYGYSRQEFLAMTILDIRPTEEITKLLRSALRPHRADRVRWNHRKKDGKVFPVNISSREVLFRGHCAELVTAEAVQGSSSHPANVSTEYRVRSKERSSDPGTAIANWTLIDGHRFSLLE
jgi:PAS domain S-box-containing protein